jgi:hypothetical protein
MGLDEASLDAMRSRFAANLRAPLARLAQDSIAV